MPSATCAASRCKFYTEEGNWDLVGNNTPVFFVRDPLKFPDFIHTQKRHPSTNMRSPTAMWDFWSLSPESLHQVTILMSDRGLPQSYRYIDGFGSHTYSFINAANERLWVKFHFKTQQGIGTGPTPKPRSRSRRPRDAPARPVRGDRARRVPEMEDLRAGHAGGGCGQAWYNPFDLTKVWPHDDYPLIEVGVLELNRNPDNYFAEIEQAAFSPSNIVPGIGFSPDKMLQARIFSYADAHRYRARHALRGAAGQQAAVPGATLPCRRRDALPDAPATPTPTTSRTRSAARPRTRASPSRRCRSPATPAATITATAMTTTRSPATCSG